MSEHEHEYRKLSDDAVFCRGCGDIKSVMPPVCTLPHYPIYPYVPYTPTWPNRPWWTPTIYQTWKPMWTVTSNPNYETGTVTYSPPSLTSGTDS